MCWFYNYVGIWMEHLSAHCAFLSEGRRPWGGGPAMCVRLLARMEEKKKVCLPADSFWQPQLTTRICLSVTHGPWLQAFPTSVPPGVSDDRNKQKHINKDHCISTIQFQRRKHQSQQQFTDRWLDHQRGPVCSFLLLSVNFWKMARDCGIVIIVLTSYSTVIAG